MSTVTEGAMQGLTCGAAAPTRADTKLMHIGGACITRTLSAACFIKYIFSR